MAKSNLPTEVHDHFQKANLLHGYFVEGMKSNIQHAIGVGNELLAAKQAIPHGSWESECDRLFDGSARTARFYMELAKHLTALPKRQKNAILYLETTLEGAAKAAKQAAKPAPPKPEPQGEEECPEEAPFEETDSPSGEDDPVDSFEPDEVSEAPADLGKCPNCGKDNWEEDEDGFLDCKACHHPHGEPAGDPDEKPFKNQRNKAKSYLEYGQRAVDDLNDLQSNPRHDEAIEHIQAALQIVRDWK